MTLAEELRKKYAVTSLKAKGASCALLAINEALEVAAIRNSRALRQTGFVV